LARAALEKRRQIRRTPKKLRHRWLRDRASLALFDRLGMDGEAENLWKAFFYAVFEGRRDVMDFGDGQGAIHGAVARD
jgi:hypothetical protein